MRLSIRYTWADNPGETLTVPVRPVTQVRWEKATGRRMSDLGTNGVGATDAVRFLAMELGEPTSAAALESWSERFEDVDIIAGPPTPPVEDQSPDNSSS